MVGLALANAVVAVAGGLHAQRSFAADLNMGIGITVIGLGSMVLGLMLVSGRRRLPVVLGGLLGGAVLHRAVTFGALELGLPAESYRLVSAILLLVVFTVAIGAERNILKDLKWS
jgi:putative tryptophan/tyrosine transport system permease protein